jgi:hypothetical protein
VFGKLLFGEYLLAGVLISTVMAFVVFILLFEMTKRDFDEHVAKRTVFYLSIFPTVYFLFAVYTEALFMALVLGSFLAARHLRNWWLAGTLGALAALTRNIGFLLILPLFVEWALYRYSLLKDETGTVKFFEIQTFRKMLDVSILALGLPLIALGGWIFFNQMVLGAALGSLTSHSSWTWEITYPWKTVIDSLRVIFIPGFGGPIAVKIDWYQGADLLDLFFFLMGTAVFLYGCLKAGRGQFPLSYLLFFGMGLASPLIAPGQFYPLLSFPRFLVTLFLMFILWAQACQNHTWLHQVTVYLWLSLLGLLFTLFSNGFWIA